MLATQILAKISLKTAPDICFEVFLLVVTQRASFGKRKEIQHFGCLFYYRWEPDFSKPPLCEIRDMWAIRGLLVVFFLEQNRDHYILQCRIFYGNFELAE